MTKSLKMIPKKTWACSKGVLCDHDLAVPLPPQLPLRNAEMLLKQATMLSKPVPFGKILQIQSRHAAFIWRFTKNAWEGSFPAICMLSHNPVCTRVVEVSLEKNATFLLHLLKAPKRKRYKRVFSIAQCRYASVMAKLIFTTTLVTHTFGLGWAFQKGSLHCLYRATKDPSFLGCSIDFEKQLMFNLIGNWATTQCHL